MMNQLSIESFHHNGLTFIKVILLSALMSTRLSQDDQTDKGVTRQIYV